MKRKAAAVTAAACFFFLLCGFTLFGINFWGQDASGETPEHLFNTANENMVKGNDAAAIELYYRILEQYPDFKDYRADVLFRLGSLLFRMERFEEAEKAFRLLADKYGGYPEIRKAYERLLYIYVQEFHDDKKAAKIRETYVKRFGDSEVLEDIDRTTAILDSQAGSSGVLKLSPAELEVKRVDESGRFDGEFFPVRSYIDRAAESPDRKFTAGREKAGNGYGLYVAGAGGGKKEIINGGRNGYAPQWLWDGSGMIFTTMDPGSSVRYIKRWDMAGKTVKTLFRAKNIGPLTCVSPDGSKIAFWYGDVLWVINGSGSSVSLIGSRVTGKNSFMMAWSSDGDKILIGYRTPAGKDMYAVCGLGRKDFGIVR